MMTVTTENKRLNLINGLYTTHNNLLRALRLLGFFYDIA